MINIVVVCGMGLGSSHFVLMNVMEILKEYEVEANVENTDLFSANFKDGDIFIGADYLMEQLDNCKNKIYLDDLVDKDELKRKLLKSLEDIYGNDR
ncbi:PTS sugar transporter subunit IIB [Tepidibacter formicigenes]|uniref:PTS system IIB component, L-Asc family n=1 Tax=Tepidibacter formicigenes DSM 15518 TaxID=1123349 RepID=A0A1M6PFB1_9FIRM|nr:PTS sugar transporter subunit IIB [Tepidibacter formicigenes]SHK06636.1 PTS system IIB component, L-Asc family [Tepidibacter formicigenes DSM 15518]